MANFFHQSVTIASYVSIEISSKGTNTSIDENSTIDDFVKIKHVGGTGDIKIGKNVYLNSGCVLYSGNGITIGNDVLIGPNCNLVPTNHNLESTKIPIRLQGFQKSKGGIIIENDVWIGANVTVLDGSIIRTGCVIAANSLVNGDTEKYCIYAGSPIKKMRLRR
jgi:acetyltransferase-like isoleucine patch superfamily enzyme